MRWLGEMFQALFEGWPGMLLLVLFLILAFSLGGDR